MVKKIQVELYLIEINDKITRSQKKGTQEIRTVIFADSESKSDRTYTIRWKGKKDTHNLKNWNKEDLKDRKIEITLNVPQKRQTTITEIAKKINEEIEDG